MAQELTQQAAANAAQTGAQKEPATPTLTPAVDIFERDEMTVIVANMPGVEPRNVDVTLERQVLTLRGQTTPYAPEGYRRLSSEYRTGDYMRVFQLSDDIDQSEIKAELKNGVLRLELPRAAETKPKKIAIKSA